MLNPGQAQKVLITGHTGFKGTWLSLMLKRAGFYVVGVSLPGTPLSLSGMLKQKFVDEECLFDITDERRTIETISAINPSYILHLAAQPLVSLSYAEPLLTFKTNVLGTANVLEAGARSTQLKSIGVITTDKVYLNNSESKRFTENSSLGGSDPYSASKAATEMTVMAWRSLKNLNGRNEANIFSLRAGNVIGGGDFAKDRLIPDLVRAKKESLDVKIRNPNSTRPWQHVLDPLNGYIAAVLGTTLEKDSDFNFGPEEPSLTVKEVVTHVSSFWPDLKVTFENSTQDSPMFESSFLEIDSSKAENQLKWKPKWNQTQAIRKTIEWWDDVNRCNLTPIEACNRDLDHFFE